MTVDYDFAVIRAVPHVHLGTFVPVGVVVHARQAGYLALRARTSVEWLRASLPDVDAELLARYLDACTALCRGDVAAGPVALAPTSERFHWLVAPASTVIQCSPVHTSLSVDPARELERLVERLVR